MFCELCNSKHTGTFGSGRFCSLKCAQTRNQDSNAKSLADKWKKFLSGKYSKLPLFVKKFVLNRANNQCELCGLGTWWNNKRLCLQIDHIDGNRKHNTLDNLRALCPNCHTQTDTWGYNGGVSVAI